MSWLELARIDFNADRARDDAEVIFSRAFGSHFAAFGAIEGLRNIWSIATSAAQGSIDAEYRAMIIGYFTDARTKELFRDPEELAEHGGIERLIQDAIQTAHRSSRNLLDSASIVFAHAVTDAAAYDLCRACAVASPFDFLPLIEKKQVELRAVMNASPLSQVRAAVDGCIERLERASLLKKVGVLHQVCRPELGWQPMRNFRFSLDALEDIDRDRHEIIHGPRLALGVANVGGVMSVLQKSVMYLACLVSHRYGLRVRPIVDEQ